MRGGTRSGRMPPASSARITLPDRYRVVRHVANGGMASVWAAEDELLGRAVAVKVLAARLAADDAAARALHSARPAPPPRVSRPPERRDDLRHRRARRPRPFIVMELLPAGRSPTACARASRSPTPSRCAGSARPPRRSTPPTRRASSTATSSRPTCCSTSAGASRCRLRHRPAGHRHALTQTGQVARHRRLPLARAGDGPARDRRQRPLRAGRRRLRAADAAPPFEAEHARRAGAPAHRGAARRPRARPPSCRRRRRRARARHGQGPRRPPRHGGGVRRRPRAVRCERPGPRPPRAVVARRAPATRAAPAPPAPRRRGGGRGRTPASFPDRARRRRWCSPWPR